MRMYTNKTARLRDTARKVAKALRGEAESIDKMDEFPPAMLGKLWDSGFMTMAAPRELGGGGSSLNEMAIVIEELAKGCGCAALIVLLQAMSLSAIAMHGAGKKREQWVSRVIDERWVLSFALTEADPDQGKGPSYTTAKKNKSEYVIRGRKSFVSGARDADAIIVFAVTNPKAGVKKALTAFLIPAGATGMLPGVEKSRAGLRGAPAVDLELAGVKVKTDSILGKKGDGYAIAQRSILKSAPLAAALSCGLLDEALDLTIKRAREMGRDPAPLSEFRAVELSLAEMAASLDRARAMTWISAGAMDEGLEEGERLAREAKWTSTEDAVKAIDEASCVWGVSGSIKGSPLERLGRDARAARLILGPNHLQKIEVARKLLAG